MTEGRDWETTAVEQSFCFLERVLAKRKVKAHHIRYAQGRVWVFHFDPCYDWGPATWMGLGVTYIQCAYDTARLQNLASEVRRDCVRRGKGDCFRISERVQATLKNRGCRMVYTEGWGKPVFMAGAGLESGEVSIAKVCTDDAPSLRIKLAVTGQQLRVVSREDLESDAFSPSYSWFQLDLCFCAPEFQKICSKSYTSHGDLGSAWANLRFPPIMIDTDAANRECCVFTCDRSGGHYGVTAVIFPWSTETE